MSNDATGGVKMSRRDAERIRKRMLKDYASFLTERRLKSSPHAAHQFALAMRHKGTTYFRSVAEIITELADELPGYWQSTD